MITRQMALCLKQANYVTPFSDIKVAKTASKTWKNTKIFEKIILLIVLTPKYNYY